MLPVTDAAGVRWITAYNSGATAVPKFGLVEIESAAFLYGRLVLYVKRPTADHKQPCAVNSWKPIPVGGNGMVTLDGPVMVAYDSAASPAFGEEWGVKTDTYNATKNYHGLTMFGSTDATHTTALADIQHARHYKRVVEFTLTQALTVNDASKLATLQSQYGPGIASPHTGAGAITVYNGRIHTASTYKYAGDVGDYGTGVHMYGTSYFIIDMECA